jgi:hypothetical protein
LCAGGIRRKTRIIFVRQADRRSLPKDKNKKYRPAGMFFRQTKKGREIKRPLFEKLAFA